MCVQKRERERERERNVRKNEIFDLEKSKKKKKFFFQRGRRDESGVNKVVLQSNNYINNINMDLGPQFLSR